MHGKLRNSLLNGLLVLLVTALCVIGLELFLQKFPMFIPAPVKDEIIKKDVTKFWIENAYQKWYEYWADDDYLGLKRPPNWHYRVDKEFYGEAVWAAYTDPTKEVSGGVDVTYNKFGFRVKPGLTSAAVVALGDSLTEGMYLSRSWPDMLSELMGVDVCNLGMGHYGPVQERLAFEKYGVPLKPKVVIMAYYEGNDLDDNEKFEKVKKSGLSWHVYDKKNADRKSASEEFRLTDTIVWAAGEYVYGRLSHHGEESADRRSPGEKGWFTYETAQGEKGFALLPGKFEQSLMTKEKIMHRPGWSMTGKSILAIRNRCNQIGAVFVVVFVPTQEHVTVPLVLKNMGADYFNSQVALLMKRKGKPMDYAEMFTRNHDNQRKSITEFCGKQNIYFFDLLPVLSDEVKKGNLVYFPRDSHFNSQGARLAADEIYRYIKAGKLIDGI